MSNLARTLCLVVTYVFATALLQGVVAAQGAAPATAAAGAIRLDVVVAHKNGPSVGGLEQGDFTVIDNKHTQPITSFRAVTGRDSKARVIIILTR